MKALDTALMPANKKLYTLKFPASTSSSATVFDGFSLISDLEERKTNLLRVHNMLQSFLAKPGSMEASASCLQEGIARVKSSSIIAFVIPGDTHTDILFLLVLHNVGLALPSLAELQAVL